MGIVAVMKHSTTARANKKTTNTKRFFIVILIIVVGIVGYFVYQQSIFTKAANSIFGQIQTWVPSSWGMPASATEQSIYGNLRGKKREATITTTQAYLPHFENKTFLTKLGFQPDMNLSADGPGSSMWGYTRNVLGKKQYVLFSYHTQPTSTKPDEPMQFDCPCQTTLSTFVSN